MDEVSAPAQRTQALLSDCVGGAWYSTLVFRLDGTWFRLREGAILLGDHPNPNHTSELGSSSCCTSML